MNVIVMRELINKVETLEEGKKLENAKTTLARIEGRKRVNTWMLENNEGFYGTRMVITEEGHIDLYILLQERYSSTISYVRVANFQQEFGCGDIFLANGKYREYKKLGTIINTLEKIYSVYGLHFDNNDNRKILKIARKQYEMYLAEQVKEQEVTEKELDEKFIEQLENSNNHMETIEIFKEIFVNDDMFVGGYDILADRFSLAYKLGEIMHKKFTELLDATIDGKLKIEDIDTVCTEMFRTTGYTEFAKYDVIVRILDYKTRKISPSYEWFMKESEWTGLMTVVDMEKIYAFEDAGLKVELYEDVEEVLVWDVAEQLEGQIRLDEIVIKEEEEEEMKNKEVLDLDENLPLGTIVGFRYDVYENDVLVDKMILTGKIVYISDDFNGKYNVETNDKKTYLVYNSDIITWERPSKKEIKISIEGEGRVEEITTNNLDDANNNLRRRIKEVVDGTTYCNKTWITIDTEEFEQPIEFRVDLIESLHGDVDDVLKLIIEEKERECKYVTENRERCTWIKDIDKFISARKELIDVLEKYLNPAPAPEPKEIVIGFERTIKRKFNGRDKVITPTGEVATVLFFDELENKYLVNKESCIECDLYGEEELKKLVPEPVIEVEEGQLVKVVEGQVVKIKNNKKEEVVKIEKPTEIVSDYVECGVKNTNLIEITEDITPETLLKLADELGLPSLDEEVSPEPTKEDIREWQGIEIENKYSKNIFDEYGLSDYLVKETGNLYIDTGSMLYKTTDGEPTKTRVDRFLAENREYEMKLLNDKYVDIPHYIIYKKEKE